jgi:hypothetical protein
MHEAYPRKTLFYERTHLRWSNSIAIFGLPFVNGDFIDGEISLLDAIRKSNDSILEDFGE